MWLHVAAGLKQIHAPIVNLQTKITENWGRALVVLFVCSPFPFCLPQTTPGHIQTAWLVGGISIASSVPDPQRLHLTDCQPMMKGGHFSMLVIFWQPSWPLACVIP